MKIIKNENTVFFDVDETLILHQDNNLEDDIFTIKDEDTNEYLPVKRHYRHIGYLKKSKARGRFVVVWSANGHKWAETVVKALGLKKYVDLCMTKPTVYFDDVDANTFMSRVYIKQGEE